MILRGSVYSEKLRMDTGITILTPKSFQGKNYQVVYLLHGLAGNHESWLTNTMLPVYAEKYEMIFVMPEVNRSFYSNMAYGLPYFSYVAEELPALIKRTFNVSAKKEETYVVGASMGGYGAFKLALTYPNVFGNAIGFSAASLFMADGLKTLAKLPEFSERQKLIGDYLAKDLEAVFGQELNASSEEADLVTLIRQFGKKLRPKLYLSCGTADVLLADNRRFNEMLKELGWQLTYHEFPGGHDWYHFNEALIKGLRWTRKKK